MRQWRQALRRIAAVAAPTRYVEARPALGRDARPGAGGRLVVLSANLWHDWPRLRRWPARLEALAHIAEAEQADVVLLQEAARTARLHADAWLADRLGMHSLYARANGHLAAIGFEEGVAVLSRYPLSAPGLRQFLSRANPFVRRVALGCLVAAPGGTLGAVSVHLSLLPAPNARQQALLPGWVSRLAGPHPAVIGGDFNAPEHRRAIGRTRAVWLDAFRHVHPRADGATHALRWLGGRPWRRQRLDYIFLHPGDQPWRVLDSRHVEAPGRAHSDHKAVVAHIGPAQS